MNATTPATPTRDGSSTATGGSPGGRSIPALVAAAVLIVLVTTAVLAFGVERPPGLSTVREVPEPAASAEVAWTSWRESGTCVHVGEPDGRARQVWCGDSGADLLGWGEAEELRVLDWADPEARTLVLDASSGEVLRSEPAPAWADGNVDDLDGEVAPDVEPEPVEVSPWDRDPAVRAFRSGGELVVEELDGAELWRVTSPDSYTLRASSASPDGEWVAAIDSADRLLLIPREGGDVRVWATDVDTDLAPAWAPGGHR